MIFWNIFSTIVSTFHQEVVFKLKFKFKWLGLPVLKNQLITSSTHEEWHNHNTMVKLGQNFSERCVSLIDGHVKHKINPIYIKLELYISMLLEGIWRILLISANMTTIVWMAQKTDSDPYMWISPTHKLNVKPVELNLPITTIQSSMLYITVKICYDLTL